MNRIILIALFATTSCALTSCADPMTAQTSPSSPTLTVRTPSIVSSATANAAGVDSAEELRRAIESVGGSCNQPAGPSEDGSYSMLCNRDTAVWSPDPSSILQTLQAAGEIKKAAPKATPFGNELVGSNFVVRESDVRLNALKLLIGGDIRTVVSGAP